MKWQRRREEGKKNTVTSLLQFKQPPPPPSLPWIGTFHDTRSVYRFFITEKKTIILFRGLFFIVLKEGLLSIVFFVWLKFKIMVLWQPYYLIIPVQANSLNTYPSRDTLNLVL